ncbi:MAG: response regulator transcription factor [Bacteroidia bacterium]|nr:response regulator transcription factor [Bacteroidia bacterium]
MVKALIVDDEKENADLLQSLLSACCPHVQIIGCAESVDTAADLIRKHKPELVFLDVELKGELSFRLFEIFPLPDFGVIFTTAHEKYALKAIKKSCIEYLLKPINPKELLAAVEKFEERKQLTGTQKKIEVLLENLGSKEQSFSKIAIPSTEGYSFVESNEILYCEASVNYTLVYTGKNESILSTKNLKEFEEVLNPAHFFRCHKSWLINLNYIKKFLRSDSQVQMSDDKLIDVSVRKKEEFLKLFDRF